MLAPFKMPEEFLRWNRQHHAPAGRRMIPWIARKVPDRFRLRYETAFSAQLNNSIRKFEYPWAFDALLIHSGKKILEIGGGLGGFQFVLAREGCEVINVDPGLTAKGRGWKCDRVTMDYFNRVFGTQVRLIDSTIDQTDLPADSIDCVVSISTIEHLLPEERSTVMQCAFELLRPGGRFVMSVDLFPELFPFTDKRANQWGENISIRDLIAQAPFRLLQGSKSELYGFSEFSTEAILSNLPAYLIGEYPALAQCIVLEKPEE